jgi:hypothetical protein
MHEQPDVNPYSAPSPDDAVYFRPNIQGLTATEIRRIAPNFAAFVLALIQKLLRWPIPTLVGHPAGEGTHIPVEQVPDDVLQAISFAVRECEQGGFLLCYATRSEAIGRHLGYSLSLASSDEKTLATVIYVKVTTPLIVNVDSCTTLTSQLSDGQVLSTTNYSPRINPPPGNLVEYHPLFDIPKLIARHRTRVAAAGELLPIARNAGSMQQFQADNHRKWLDFQRSRGAMTPLTPEQVARLRRQGANGQAPDRGR